jgi:hypothetical protein
MITASNIHYELADRVQGLGSGGIGAMLLLARRIGLIRDIDHKLHLLKRHSPYHESDHVLGVRPNFKLLASLGSDLMASLGSGFLGVRPNGFLGVRPNFKLFPTLLGVRPNFVTEQIVGAITERFEGATLVGLHLIVSFQAQI